MPTSLAGVAALTTKSFVRRGGRKLLDPFDQLFAVDRLADVAVHACVQATVGIARQRVGRQGDDRHAGLLGVRQVADRSGGCQTVHDRHLNVHEHYVEILPVQGFHRLSPIASNLHGMPAFAENIGEQLLVRRSILG